MKREGGSHMLTLRVRAHPRTGHPLRSRSPGGRRLPEGRRVPRPPRGRAAPVGAQVASGRQQRRWEPSHCGLRTGRGGVEQLGPRRDRPRAIGVPTPPGQRAARLPQARRTAGGTAEPGAGGA